MIYYAKKELVDFLNDSQTIADYDNDVRDISKGFGVVITSLGGSNYGQIDDNLVRAEHEVVITVAGKTKDNTAAKADSVMLALANYKSNNIGFIQTYSPQFNFNNCELCEYNMNATIFINK